MLRRRTLPGASSKTAEGVCHFHIIQLDGAGREMLLAENAIGFFHLENILKQEGNQGQGIMPGRQGGNLHFRQIRGSKSLLENGFPSQNALHSQRRES